MNTLLKSDALLDAFESFKLTDVELDSINGGDKVAWRLPNKTQIITATMDDSGKITYTDILGKELSPEKIIKRNDHYFNP